MKISPHPAILLFDIDGTLVAIGGAGRRAMERAFARVCGSADACPTASFGGHTDRGIVASGLESAQMEVNEENFQRFFSVYHDFLREELQQSSKCRALPGATSLLQQLSSMDSIALGLGTGNTQEGAFAKLRTVGLSSFFSFGGFGCDHADRSEVIRLGAARGAQILNIENTKPRVVVIGDTPRDISAAKAVGAESIAIATGEFSADELMVHTPTACFPGLEAPGLLSSLIRTAPDAHAS